MMQGYKFKGLQTDEIRTFVTPKAHVTWDLVHELQQAADLAGGMGQVNVEKRLSRWSVKLVNALCASSAPRSEESTSQYWIG